MKVDLSNISDNVVTGYNVLGQNERPLEGTYKYTELDNYGSCVVGVLATLSEPGDDEWDGVFEITFVGYMETFETEEGTIECIESISSSEAVGVWSSNNGKAEYEFTRRKSD